MVPQHPLHKRRTRKSTRPLRNHSTTSQAPNTLYLYHQTEPYYLADIMREGALLPASKTGNNQQNPFSNTSPYIFFNVFAQQDLYKLANSGGVGLVFEVTDALLGKTLYTSEHHSTGDTTRKGVRKHVFRNRASMLRVFRALRNKSVRVATGTRNDSSDENPWFDSEIHTVTTATAFQEVFTTFEMPVTALRYVLLNKNKSNKNVHTLVRKHTPHVSIIVYQPTERTRISNAKLALHATKIEGIRYTRTQVETALQELSPYTSVAAQRLCRQLQAVLK